MFTRVSSLVLLALPLLAVASAVSRGAPSSCSTGPVQCCNSVQQASTPSVSNLLGLLGIVANANVPVGLTCTPVTIIGVSGNNCNAQTVCCENNNFNGVVALGCTPINVAL